MKIVTGEQMNQVDRITIDERGIAGSELMENAGHQVARRVLRLSAVSGKQNVLVICGSGNNGGDGFVVARRLHEKGLSVQVAMAFKEKKLSGDAAAKFKLMPDVIPKTFLLPDPKKKLPSLLDEADLIVDAIFGTGFKGELKEDYIDIISLVNSSDDRIIAVDIPSGVESDTGRVVIAAIECNETVTFGLPKLGCVLYPGASYCGRLSVVDIGFPPDVLAMHDDIKMTESGEAIMLLPKRKDDTHKNACGRVFVLAGSVGLTGAAAMTSQAALKTGAGIVTLGMPKSLNDILEIKLTEVMTMSLSETSDRTISNQAYKQVVEAMYDFDVLALGPGLSINKETKISVLKLIKKVSKPIVVDADGLNALCGAIEVLIERVGETVITPHPGELARLFEVDTSEVQNDRLGYAKRAAQEWNTTVVLKGYRSLIASPNGKVAINPTGNSGMATAGTGDVLTGMIASFGAQGLQAVDAAVLGTYLHGLAGDLVAKDKTDLSLIASDLIEYLPKAIKRLKLVNGKQ